MNRLPLIIPLIIVFIFSCSEEDEPVIEPSVQTLDVVQLGDSLYFTGEILNVATTVVDSYGFIIHILNAHGNNLHFLTLEDSSMLKTKIFQMSILNDLEEKAGYTVMAFARTDTKYYGNAILFDGQGYLAPVISGFDPKEAKSGEYIKIYGTNFGLDLYGINVMFGDTEAEIISIHNDRVVVKTPSYRIQTEVPITIQKKNFQVTATEPFTYYGPKVESFSPDEGKFVTEVVIAGSNFSPYHWRNKVTLDNVYHGNVISSTENSIHVQFDFTNIRPGEHYIVVETDEILGIAQQIFSVATGWVPLAAKPEEGVYNTTSFVIDDKIYICTGSSIFADGGGRHAQLWEYDVSKNLWNRKADFPGGVRVAASAFAIDGKGYFGCGYERHEMNDFWEYDPALDNWMQKAPFPGDPREAGIGFSYGGKGYIGLGDIRWDSEQDIWSYDPQLNSWEKIPDFIGHRRVGAMVAIKDNKLFVIGGGDSSRPFEPDIWRFDFQSGEWALIGLIDRENFFPVATFYDNESCYVLSSERNYVGEDLLKLYEFDPERNQIVRNLGVFAGDYRLSVGFSEMIDHTLYTGLGFIGGNNLADDIWKIDLNEIN